MLAPLFLAAVSLPTSRAGVVIAFESGVEAYSQAVEGITMALGSTAARLVDVQSADADLAQALSSRDLQVIIAVGSNALARVQSRRPSAPVIAIMVLHSTDTAISAHVDLELSLASQLGAMRTLWPGRTRAAIIRNPAHSRYSADELESRARKEGFSLLVIDCDGPARLVKALSEIKGQADFLLCLPDPDLYNAVTIKPLVLAALETRLPIVGFSPAFVRAGATVGIYPDYREIGRQAAEMSLRLLRGEDRGADESPRRIQVAVNQRVSRLLGVEFQTAALPVEVLR